jgi:hypothetical protein
VAPHSPPTADALVGTWLLRSWQLVYDDDRPPEYPLGPDATGFLLYTPDGHVSAMLSRARRERRAAATALEKSAAYDEVFAYTGRFHVRDGAVYHAIEASTNASLIGVTSTRFIKLDGENLTLSGPDFHPGAARSQIIAWRRALKPAPR